MVGVSEFVMGLKRINKNLENRAKVTQVNIVAHVPLVVLYAI